jgi:uncharacterized protein (TIGR00255 family)
MPRSMTGFARSEAQTDWGSLSCEIRSVNHRYLEPGFRLPESLRSIENDFRNGLKQKLSRGKVEVNLQLRVDEAQNTALVMNEELAEQVSALAGKVFSQLDNASSINPMDVLRWPGVIQAQEVDAEAIKQLALKLFGEALDKLIEAREREGAELAQMIEQRLSDISAHVATVRERLPEILQSYREKLRERLTALALEVEEDRLAQELAIVAQKADVAEELDRLEAHVSEVARNIQQKKPIGRRLDFLMQELNREANTLSSKSMASDTTQIAVDLKVLIEQMREQIQNIE